MTQDKNTRPIEDEQAEPAETPAENDIEQPEGEQGNNDPVTALQQENAELRDRLMRAVAEMENLRKRTEREVQDAKQYAISSFARDMLTIGDNMRRALEATGSDDASDDSPALRTLIDGIGMTERELDNALDRHGVRKLDPSGERFDPHFHQAMLEVEDTSVPTGTVTQVMQVGYNIKDRVLRPAMVAVSKGGPKPSTEGAAEPTDPGNEADHDSPSVEEQDGTPGSTVNRTA